MCDGRWGIQLARTAATTACVLLWGCTSFYSPRVALAPASDRAAPSAAASHGRVVSLDDERFSARAVTLGERAPQTFLARGLGDVYLLEDFDAGRIPVLFVHGIKGSPRDFRYLIQGLDRRKYQAWVYYYPSGEGLGAAAGQLQLAVHTLEQRYATGELIVVAHSMGGLIARDFVLRHARSGSDVRIPLLVTLSTPWSGHRAAAYGIRLALRVKPSWYDIVPDSPYLARLFAGAEQGFGGLPATTRHHLIFSYLERSGSRKEAGDEVVTLASQLRAAAQAEACRIYGFETSHMGVLTDERVAALLNRLLRDVGAEDVGGSLVAGAQECGGLHNHTGDGGTRLATDVQAP